MSAGKIHRAKSFRQCGPFICVMGKVIIMDDEYINIGRWFSILHRRSQLFVVEACEQLHLTYSECVMLIRLYDAEGSKQDDLASMLFLDKAVVTRTMNLLQEKGLVERKRDEHDRRVRRVYLTEYGRQQHIYLRNVIQRWVDFLAGGMDPEQVKTIIHGFHTLADSASRVDLHQLARDIPATPTTDGLVEQEGVFDDDKK